MSRRAVASLAVAETVSWGILYYAYGVLIPFLERDLDASKAAVSGAFSVALLAAAGVAGPAGRGLDRWGTRRVMTLGSVVGASALAILAGATRLWHLYASLIFVGVAHAAVLYEPAFTAIARWFSSPAPRTRALLVVTSCAGLASTLFLPLTAFLCVRHGWRATVLVLAAGLAVVTIPLHASLPRDGAGGRPARGRGGGGLALLSALQAFVSAGVTVHLVAFLDGAGHGLAGAAAIAGLLGAAQVPGRLLFAPLSRWRRARLSLLLGVQALALVGIVATPGLIVVPVALFGAANGMFTLERATLVAERFPAGEHGAVNGRIATLSLLARAAAPFAVALLAGAASFAVAFAALAAILLGAAVRSRGLRFAIRGRATSR